MARSSAQLSDASADPEAPFGYKPDGTPRRRKASESGTRTVTPISILSRVVDVNGQKIEGAKLEIVYVGRDAKQVLDLLNEQRDLNLTRVEARAAE